MPCADQSNWEISSIVRGSGKNSRTERRRCIAVSSDSWLLVRGSGNAVVSIMLELEGVEREGNDSLQAERPIASRGTIARREYWDI
jgi:hypothetical protein